MKDMRSFFITVFAALIASAAIGCDSGTAFDNTDDPTSDITDESKGGVGGWTTSSMQYTNGREFHSSIVHNGYVYVIGGCGLSSSYYNQSELAKINADGSSAAWSINTNDFTPGRCSHSSIVYNDYVYVIGGYRYNSGDVHYNDVQYAHIDSNGNIGTWATTQSFTNSRQGHTSVVNKDYAYIIGGSNGSTYYNNVLYAHINSDGTIGSWTATTSFADARQGHASVVNNDYIYIIGGSNDTTNFNGVQYAHINSNGTIGVWASTTPLSTGRYGHACVVWKGYIYVTGGYDGDVFYNDVQYAKINNDGTIGEWNKTTPFSTARLGHTSVVNNGYLYVIGGYTGGYYNREVQYAKLND